MMRFVAEADHSADVFEVNQGRHYMGTLRVLVGLQVHKPPEWCQSRHRRVSDPRRLEGKRLAYLFIFRGLILTCYVYACTRCGFLNVEKCAL